MQLLCGEVGDVLAPGQEDGVHLGATELFGQVAVVELDEAVKREVLLPGGEVDDEGGGDVAECIELVGLAEVDHVPDQPLLVGDFPVELEVVEAQAVLAELVVLEPEGVLRPLQEDALVIAGFREADALGEGAFDCLVVVALAEVVVADVVIELLDGLHLGEVE